MGPHRSCAKITVVKLQPSSRQLHCLNWEIPLVTPEYMIEDNNSSFTPNFEVFLEQEHD